MITPMKTLVSMIVGINYSIQFTLCPCMTGVVDSSGIEFFYTNTPPVHNAGMFTVAYAATSVQVIPPGADNFITKALCPSKCSEKVRISTFQSLIHYCFIYTASSLHAIS